MEQQKTPNHEKVKQLTMLNLESLKFIQHFFLPLISGIVAMHFTAERLGMTTFIIADSAGGLMLIFLYLLRRKIAKEFRRKINEL